jgi:hypothetical protein
VRVPAAKTIVETARYWMDRIDHRPDGQPVLLGVMGPNEYTPISSNNAYTNWMVAFNLRLAAAVGTSGGATRREILDFKRTADALPMHRRESREAVGPGWRCGDRPTRTSSGCRPSRRGAGHYRTGRPSATRALISRFRTDTIRQPKSPDRTGRHSHRLESSPLRWPTPDPHRAAGRD